MHLPIYPVLRCGIFFAALALLAVCRGEEGRPVIDIFSAREIGADAMSWTSVQSANGTLYFGCNAVLSYDGERWTSHEVPNSYAIRALAFGEKGRLWVGGVNEVGFFEREGQTISSYHSLRSHLPANIGELGDVWHVFAQGEGAIFVTHDRILSWDGTKFKIWEMPGERRLPAMQMDGKVYVHHAKTGLWIIEPEGPKLFLPPEVAGNAWIFWMEKSPAGVLLGTSAGLFKLEANHLEPYAPSVTGFIQNNSLTSVCRLPNGCLGLGTFNGGLAIVTRDGQSHRIISTDEGLPARAVYSLFVDRDDALWITSGTEISRARLDGGTSFFDARSGLSGKSVHNVDQYGEDLVAATDDGVFGLRLSPSAASRFQLIPQLADRYTDLLGGQTQLFAAGRHGVDLLKSDQVIRIFDTQADVFIFDRSVYLPGSYLLADGFNVTRLIPAENGTHKPQPIAQLPDEPTSLAEDSRGDIWAGTVSRGIFHVPNYARQTASGNSLIAPQLAATGRSFVARVNQCIVAFTNRGPSIRTGEADTFQTISGPPRTRTTAISNCDSNGDIWVAFASPFKSGKRVPLLGKLSVEENGKNHWAPYAVEGTELVGEVKSLFVDNRNIVWLGGTTGLLRIDPREVRLQSIPRRPLLFSTVAEDEKLPSQNNGVRFDFSALEFGRREGIRFQTMLSGNDQDWSAPSDASSFTLTSLREGEYEFKVRVISDAGLVSPEAAWRFTVLPPWYRTTGALVGFGCLALAGAFGIAHWRSRYLRWQNIHLEELVRKKTAELERANAAKTEFVANMSHEIRNPISGVLGLAMALEDTPLSERQRMLNESIRSCASLLATLVDDVLDFAKIEAGQIELKSAPFSLRSIMEQCVAMFGEASQKAGSKITIILSGDLPGDFIGDSARIQQILVNYLGNALKFGAGREIIMGASSEVQGRVRFYVKDCGPGIAKQDAATLFTKFTRLKSARDGNIRGTGLGLAVCRLLATKMGGSVGVESELGEGSCFWVALPLAVATAPDHKEAASLPPGKSLRALVVEDLEYNALAMQAVLRRVGLESDVASNGPDALEKLRGGHYDVAFMDWDLPGMNGAEVTRFYRNLEPAHTHKRTLIIAATAHSAPANREACLRAGMDAFITKPLTPEKIARALDELKGHFHAAPSVEVQSKEPSTGTQPGLDLQLLQFLADDSKDNLEVQIERFLISYEDVRQKARQAIVAGSDAAALYRAGHKLLSHAKMIGAHELAELALHFQEASKDGNAVNMGTILDEFDREFATVRSRLETIRVSKSPG